MKTAPEYLDGHDFLMTNAVSCAEAEGIRSGAFCEPGKNPKRREWVKAPGKAFYSGGRLNQRTGMELHTSEPIEIEISGNRGFLIDLEGSNI